MVIKPRKQTQHKYYLGLEQLKVVKTYKYLGLDFQDNLRWNLTQERLTAKARSRVALLRKGLNEGLSLKAAESMWWTMVVPVLNYGAELWGIGKCVEVERVQLEAGRRMLGVGRKMADTVVRGELGWWRMRAQRDMKKLLYWGRLVRMNDNRLPKQVYRQRRSQPKRRSTDWCSQIQNLLKDLGLEQLWFSEKVGSEKEWKSGGKSVIQTREEALWKGEMEKKKKLRLYRTIKFGLEREEYLDVVSDFDERRLVAALRGGTNQLQVEVGRWKKKKLSERTCSVFASGEAEDERHFLFDCSAYERERKDWLSNIRSMTRYDLAQMEDDMEWMTNMILGVGCVEREERNIIQRQTARFVPKGFKKRTFILN
jgi:hypothetical protein